ncbi:protein containing DUF669 [Candidatus Magnetobacterium bavaricum]|uniref:Protein containing DUF669 n=1 Tax=Candidatus Magnetobacterium bavaricum TaxID=29290 RepID=A0A0F3GVU7_9BACT|nr:protein containing DUF669 [Candidatus Magnetobacterium bavaricum]
MLDTDTTELIDLDFTDIEDINDFSPLPEGKYLCKVESVDIKQNKDSNDMWSLKLKVIEGEYGGRFIFDNMVFSANGIKRIKHILKAMGFDVSGKLKLSTDKLIDRQVFVDTVVEDYDNAAGEKRKKSKVTFAGYEMYDGQDAPPTTSSTGKKSTTKAMTTASSQPVEDDNEYNIPF